MGLEFDLEKAGKRGAEVGEKLRNDLIKKLRESKKPDARFLDLRTVEKLKDPDCLSIDCYVARNGGSDTIPFVEGTPELIALLKEIYKT